MELQQVYNATYNHFAGRKYWPQFVEYDETWEFSNNYNIKHAYCVGRRDGLKCYLRKDNVEPTEELLQTIINKLSNESKARRIR